MTNWISEYTAYERDRIERRTCKAIASALYASPWGHHTEPDANGVQTILPGYPRSIGGYVERAFRMMNRAGLIAG